MKALAERCRAIELLALDVDGVLTPGDIIYETPVGDPPEVAESKRFFVRDGSALVRWNRSGKVSAILTGRRSEVVRHRAAELGIAHVSQGLSDKLAALHAVLEPLLLGPERVCYVGDDLPDLEVMRACGLAAAPADALPEVRREAHFVTRRPGERGAVREVIELVLRCQGQWRNP